EIAKQLKRSEKTVNTQIFRGKKLLADKLREAGYGT
ncbi:MAG: sigma-70 family RNA polymerase sigma factor, partial [Clostridia bacterium]|nr:sigma-70 family RNA polymerase sigma factor [Clostridia bacterium]